MDRTRRNLMVGAALAALAAGVFGPTFCAKRQIATRPRLPEGRPPPPRPPGQPKPLLEEDLAPVLSRLDAWYATHLPPRYQFNPPATSASLDEFERIIGLRLPPAYRQLYAWHDGDLETNDRWGHIYGLPLLSLKEATLQWQGWKRVLADFHGDRYRIPGGSWPAGAVDPAYINLRWIPLTNDGSGNHIGLDMDPWPGGRVGQVILFGRDEEVKAVLAPSLGKFLEWIADLLEGGNFRLEAKADELPLLRLFRLKSHPALGFHDASRKLLNAPGPFL